MKRHVVYLRGSREGSYVAEGFKNSSSAEAVKEHPLFPESFAALKGMRPGARVGLVFRNSRGSFFTYREIQSRYDRAFKRAGLPYSGTHVMRHGGTRRVYNATGDLAIAQQLLGNSDMRTTLVYAKREKSALTKLAKAEWCAKVDPG